MLPALTPVETRVLGCLLEKERLTPENYPLSLNSLTAACNQSTNRDPVLSLDEKTVEAAVNALREKKLASVIFGAGSRVQKYRHKVLEVYELTPAEVALLCVLLLRGPQTPGELRSRTERLHPFESTAAVEARLDELARGADPLIRRQPARPGQKESRYLQLLSLETADAGPIPHAALSTEHWPLGTEHTLPPPHYSPSPIPTEPPSLNRTDALIAEVDALRAELEQLREEFRTFRKQFE